MFGIEQTRFVPGGYRALMKSAGAIMGKHHARAMYDDIEGMLTSITMQLRSAIDADANMPALENGSANGTEASLRRANGWARQVAAELGAVLVDTLGLAATIEWHLHQFQKCTGILYELTVSNAVDVDLPEKIAAAIFDSYGEALSNVARHAGASRVIVALTVNPKEVILSVADNGIGIGNEDAFSGAGGLADMRERLQALKGYCDVSGILHAGTTVIVNLPIPLAA